jgi:hypothetical protein
MEADRLRAVGASDPSAIAGTENARALVLERLTQEPLGKDTLHACGVLGTMLAREGASPTLAAATMDGAAAVVGDVRGMGAARAAFAEAYAKGRDEALRAAQLARWDAPSCVVPIGDGTFAVAAGVPDDDGEALQRWADGTATWLRKARARRVVCAGGDRACAALGEALAVFGVEMERKPR